MNSSPSSKSWTFHFLFFFRNLPCRRLLNLGPAYSNPGLQLQPRGQRWLWGEPRTLSKECLRTPIPRLATTLCSSHPPFGCKGWCPVFWHTVLSGDGHPMAGSQLERKFCEVNYEGCRAQRLPKWKPGSGHSQFSSPCPLEASSVPTLRRFSKSPPPNLTECPMP